MPLPIGEITGKCILFILVNICRFFVWNTFWNTFFPLVLRLLPRPNLKLICRRVLYCRNVSTLVCMACISHTALNVQMCVSLQADANTVLWQKHTVTRMLVSIFAVFCA